MGKQILSADFDGCFSHEIITSKLNQLVHKKQANESVTIQKVAEIYNMYNQEFPMYIEADEVLVGSNRQDVATDKANSQTKTSDVSSYAIYKELFGERLNPLLLADAFFNKKPGKHMNDALEQLKDGFLHHDKSAKFMEKPAPFDETKVGLIYFQMHAVAHKYPNEEINFTFVDDRPDIIATLNDFFKKNPQTIPPNVTLKVIHHAYNYQLQQMQTQASTVHQPDVHSQLNPNYAKAALKAIQSDEAHEKMADMHLKSVHKSNTRPLDRLYQLLSGKKGTHKNITTNFRGKIQEVRSIEAITKDPGYISGNSQAIDDKYWNNLKVGEYYIRESTQPGKATLVCRSSEGIIKYLIDPANGTVDLKSRGQIPIEQFKENLSPFNTTQSANQAALNEGNTAAERLLALLHNPNRDPNKVFATASESEEAAYLFIKQDKRTIQEIVSKAAPLSIVKFADSYPDLIGDFLEKSGLKQKNDLLAHLVMASGKNNKNAQTNPAQGTIPSTLLKYTEKDGTRIIAVLGQKYPMYQSTGQNSGQKGTFFPFAGIMEKNIPTLAGYRKGVFAKPIVYNHAILRPNNNPFFPETLIQYIHDHKVDKEMMQRMGNMECLAISSQIGGGYWNTVEGKGIKDFIETEFPDYIDDIRQNYRDDIKALASIDTLPEDKFKTIKEAVDINGEIRKEIKDFSIGEGGEPLLPNDFNMDNMPEPKPGSKNSL